MPTAATVTLAGVATILALLAAPGQASAQQSAIIESSAWIAGCWERRSGQSVTEEQWMPPRGGAMLGMSRTVRDGRLVEYEFLRLFERDGRLVYHATPSRQTPTEFTSTATSDTLAVFENPAHDFPQRIIYRRQGSDSLIARIEGPGPGGTRGVDFRFARAQCSGAHPAG